MSYKDICCYIIVCHFYYDSHVHAQVYTCIDVVCYLIPRFQPDRGFSGADQAPTRDGPVQFEKDTEEDPFGLNKFLTEAKKAKRPVTDR